MDSDSTPTAKTASKPLGSLGRDEMNLAEFPITLLTDRVPKDQREAVYQDDIFDERSGLTLTRKLTITAGNHGLTTPVDDEVILALIQITRLKNNFTSPKVEFSRHELIQLLGWSVGGAKYERIETSLDRWTSVYLKYENAWRDNRTKTWTSVGFHIIDKYELNDTRTGSDQLDLLPSYIVWGEDIFQSFQAGYLKPLDYDLCMGLRNSTAKRMYRFLDKRFHHKPDWLFDLKEFAHEHIGLGRHYEGPAHLKRNLEPPLTELESIGFLAPLPAVERFPKSGREWKIRLLKQPDAPLLLTAATGQQSPEPSPLAKELIERGVTEDTATELAQHHLAEIIQLKIEVFDWLRERKDKRIARSPSGYLVKSIQSNYAVPDGFKPKAERDRQAAEAAAMQRRTAEAGRLKRLEEARQDLLRQSADAYIKRLSPAERAEVEVAALAAASDEARANYDNPVMRSFRSSLMVGMLRDFVQIGLSSGQLAVADA